MIPNSLKQLTNDDLITREWFHYLKNLNLVIQAWNPTIFGTTSPGSHTYIDQAGIFVKLDGGCLLAGHITVGVKDNSMTGNLAVGNLPTSIDDNQIANVSGFSGFTLPSGYTFMGLKSTSPIQGLMINISGSGKSIISTSHTDIPGSTFWLDFFGMIRGK